jgi:hypothetical protein
MKRSFQIEVDGKGKLDKRASGFVRQQVESVIDTMDSPTITALADKLGIHIQRAGRLVRALGLRERFEATGRPSA